MRKSEQEILADVSKFFAIEILKAFNYNEQCLKAVETIAKSLNDIYRYFEPGFFKGNLFVVKHFTDAIVLTETSGVTLSFSHEKNILLNKIAGDLVIQIFDSDKIILWEGQDADSLTGRNDLLIYHFHDNHEAFLANSQFIDVTEYSEGSRFATQFFELKDALKEYAVTKIYNSSCDRFSQSWVPNNNRIFFQGGGQGSNIPEKYMQESLHNYLNIHFSRGITVDSYREFNTIALSPKPKPVDIAIHWKRDNRLALIEVKFLGAVKPISGVGYAHGDKRANEGITQLKGYFDSASSDLPTTIIQSYLVIIDGRRNNITPTTKTKTINHSDGMHYKDQEIVIDPDKKFHETIPGFQKPIKMFAKPICS